jgi:hypothetical protein
VRVRSRWAHSERERTADTARRPGCGQPRHREEDMAGQRQRTVALAPDTGLLAVQAIRNGSAVRSCVVRSWMMGFANDMRASLLSVNPAVRASRRPLRHAPGKIYRGCSMYTFPAACDSRLVSTDRSSRCRCRLLGYQMREGRRCLECCYCQCRNIAGASMRRLRGGMETVRPGWPGLNATSRRHRVPATAGERSQDRAPCRLGAGATARCALTYSGRPGW